MSDFKACSSLFKGSFPHRGYPTFGSSQDDAVQVRLAEFALLAGAALTHLWQHRLTLVGARGRPGDAPVVALQLHLLRDLQHVSEPLVIDTAP